MGLPAQPSGATWRRARRRSRAAAPATRHARASPALAGRTAAGLGRGAIYRIGGWRARPAVTSTSGHADSDGGDWTKKRVKSRVPGWDGGWMDLLYLGACVEGGRGVWVWCLKGAHFAGRGVWVWCPCAESTIPYPPDL